MAISAHGPRVLLNLLILAALAACDSSGDTQGLSSGSSGNAGNAYAYSDDSAGGAGDDGAYTDSNLRQPVQSGAYDPAPRKPPGHPVFRSFQQKFSPLINREAKKQGMDPFFIHAIVSQESRYQPHVVSGVGAGGIMQIMPNTAKELGISSAQRFTPEIAVPAGIKYLRRMMKWSGGNIQAMATGYNSGPARGKALFLRDTSSRYWRKYGEQPSTSNGVPSPKFHKGETYNYASYVAWFYEFYKANPHLVGLADNSPSASDCQARGIC